MTDISSRG